jgi:hypothetical protein
MSLCESREGRRGWGRVSMLVIFIDYPTYLFFLFLVAVNQLIH